MLRTASVQSFGVVRCLYTRLHLLQLGDALADVLEVLCLHLLEALFRRLTLETTVGARPIGRSGLVGLRQREAGSEKRSDNEGVFHEFLLRW
jgi:hypothetical protein